MWTPEIIGSLVALSIFAFVSLSIFSSERERILLIVKAERERIEQSKPKPAVATGDVMPVESSHLSDVTVVSPADITPRKSTPISNPPERLVSSGTKLVKAIDPTSDQSKGKKNK